MMAGAMSPVTPAASVAQVHAEMLATIALYQLLGAGAPIVYGSFLTTLDLKSGAPTYGTPEANLCTFATAQLARRLGVPVRCGGMYTNAKLPDAQAMSESVTACDAGVMAGTNMIWHAAGWLEGGMVASFEKYVLDLDHIGALHRTMQGLSFDDNELAQEAYMQRGEREVFLGIDHTQKNFATANFRAPLADNGPFEHWIEAGGIDAAQRANRRWKAMLESYSPPPIDAAVADAIADFIARRKAETPDAWH
jgi:trimethylamine--corrinoid protein Co-methyltransferase